MIHLQNVTKTFGKGQMCVHALKNISLHVNKGECAVLKGASGSGKSTILSLMAGLSKPTTGDIVINGKFISKLLDHFSAEFRRRNIGFIFQKFHLLPNLSVRENIIIPLIPENLSSEEITKRVEYVMNVLSLTPKASITTRLLSGGEQQRVAIARAMIHEPQIIIADEPTANLDTSLSESFIQAIRMLKQNGKTIVIATHDPLFFDLDYVDKVIEIKNGEILS